MGAPYIYDLSRLRVKQAVVSGVNFCQIVMTGTQLSITFPTERARMAFKGFL